MSEWDGVERRNSGELTVLSAKLQSLHDDVSEMRSALRDLANAITKLAIIEERQTNTQMAQDRAFTAISNVERRLAEIEKLLPSDLGERLSALERKSPITDLSNKWVFGAITAIAGGVVVYILDHFKKGGH